MFAALQPASAAASICVCLDYKAHTTHPSVASCCELPLPLRKSVFCSAHLSWRQSGTTAEPPSRVYVCASHRDASSTACRARALGNGRARCRSEGVRYGMSLSHCLPLHVSLAGPAGTLGDSARRGHPTRAGRLTALCFVWAVMVIILSTPPFTRCHRCGLRLRPVVKQQPCRRPGWRWHMHLPECFRTADCCVCV